jgi:hypothetical protein
MKLSIAFGAVYRYGENSVANPNFKKSWRKKCPECFSKEPQHFFYGEKSPKLATLM